MYKEELFGVSFVDNSITFRKIDVERRCGWNMFGMEIKSEQKGDIIVDVESK